MEKEEYKAQLDAACEKFNKIFLSAFRFQKGARGLVRRENGTGCAEFRAHIRDRCALRNRQRLYPFACVFHNCADPAFYAE